MIYIINYLNEPDIRSAVTMADIGLTCACAVMSEKR